MAQLQRQRLRRVGGGHDLVQYPLQVVGQLGGDALDEQEQLLQLVQHVVHRPPRTEPHVGLVQGGGRTGGVVDELIRPSAGSVELAGQRRRPRQGLHQRQL